MEYLILLTLLTIILALLIDLVMGEPPVFIHPVVWMGKLIQILKNLFKRPSKMSGFLLTIIMIVIFTVPVIIMLYFVKYNDIIFVIVSGILLSTTFSIKFLIKSSRDIAMLIENDPHMENNLEKTRKSVSYLVSRDTSNLSESQLVSATVESLTENITDSVISPLFYAFILGLPGAIAYRVVNTLDAMVGYKNKEYKLIGWFPARLDDYLNYIPARISGIMVVMAAFILGMDWKNSYYIMRRDARNTPSPNSGYSMAAAAGALQVKLDKPHVYQLGDNNSQLNHEIIFAAIKLTKLTVFLFIIIFSLLFLLLWTIVIC